MYSTGIDQRAQSAREQQHVRMGFNQVTGFDHGGGYVGTSQCGHVVDTITNHRHYPIFGLQFKYGRNLIFRQQMSTHLRHTHRFRHRNGRCLIVAS